jgi:putative ABC transport system permease protein
VLTALGTMVGVAAVITTVGLTQGSAASVSAAFDSQLPTQLSFQQASGATGSPSIDAIGAPSSGTTGAPSIDEQAEQRVDRLAGVVHAGLVSPVNGGQPLAVSRTEAGGSGGSGTLDVPFTVVSPGALATMHAALSYGRLYDKGFESRHEMVALLGATVAAQLGIARTDGGPAIFVNSIPLTVIGVVRSARQQSQALLGVMVPPDVGASIGSTVGPPSVIVQASRGAAQVVGEEGPYAISAEDPKSIVAEVPPDPRTLRRQVQGSVSSLLVVLALISFAMGIVAIGNTALLSVLQRSGEIGLRRSLGATPRHVRLLVLGEAGLVGGIGGVLGASTGVLVVTLADVANGWAVVLSWQFLVVAPILGLVAGLVAGVYPAHRATRISPVAALQR